MPLNRHVKDDPKKPYKAIMAGAVSAGCTFVAIWIVDTGSFTPKEMGAAALMALAASGLTGVPTFVKKNPKVDI